MADLSLHIPLWLELSGMPAAANRVCKTPAGWPVFLKIAALDTRQHPRRPGTVGISMQALAAATGIEPAEAAACVEALREARYLLAFVPDNDEEEALLALRVPLPTPISAEQVRLAHPDLFARAEPPFRYESLPVEQPDDDPVLQEIVDLYLNTISMKINTFVLDELVLLRRRFDLPSIRRVFEQGKRIGITQIGWVLKQLHREAAKRAAQSAAAAALVAQAAEPVADPAPGGGGGGLDAAAPAPGPSDGGPPPRRRRARGAL